MRNSRREPQTGEDLSSNSSLTTTLRKRNQHRGKGGSESSKEAAMPARWAGRFRGRTSEEATGRLFSRLVYSFPITVITNYHRLSGPKRHTHSVLDLWRSEV